MTEHIRSRRRSLSLKAQEARLGYILVTPTVLVVTLIVLFPMIWNVILSLQPIRLANLPTVDLLDFSKFTLRNYERAITARGGYFWKVLLVTFQYTIGSTILALLMGLWAALIVRDTFPGRNIVRGFLLFPYIAPVVSVAFIWKLMLDKNIGVITLLLEKVGVPPISYLTTRTYPIHLGGLEIGFPLALATVILFEAWRYFPFAFLFFLARLQAVPDDLYEAAAVDGASPLQRFWYITLPQLYAVAGTLFLLRFIWTFNKFDDIFLLNGGAAGTEVLAIQIYNWLFARRNVGVSSAVAVIMAAVLGVVVFIYLRWFVREEE